MRRRNGATGGQMATSTIVFATLLAAVSLPLCVVLAAGMLPTGVALVVDRSSRRYLAWTVGAANFAGMMWPVAALLRSGLSLDGALHMLRDPRNWLVMYGGAAIGWGLSEAMPMLARAILEFRANETERKLRKRAQRLAEEWGGEVGSAEASQPPR
jgi:hypothetical protein